MTRWFRGLCLALAALLALASFGAALAEESVPELPETDLTELTGDTGDTGDAQAAGDAPTPIVNHVTDETPAADGVGVTDVTQGPEGAGVTDVTDPAADANAPETPAAADDSATGGDAPAGGEADGAGAASAADGTDVTDENQPADGANVTDVTGAPVEAPADATPELIEPEGAVPDGADAAVAAPEMAEGGEVPTDAAAPAVQPEPIRLNATALTLGVKETFALTPVVPAGAEGVTFQYASSSAKVAVVGADGVITAKKKGKATIAVTASTGEVLACEVTVVKAPKKITLSATSGTLGFDAATGTGTSYRLGVSFPKNSGATPRFSGYDANIVSVAEDGTITARGVGVTTVTVSTFNGKSASCKVTVLGAPDAIAFADPAPAMIEREKRKLAVNPSPENTVAYASFASDNPGVAAVDAGTGEVTGVAQGEATITATSFNGRTATCRVTVLPGPDRIALSASTVLVAVGDTVLLDATPVRNDGTPTGTGLTYSSSKTKVLAIAADGAMTGKKKGTAKVTVAAANGVQAVCTVRVVKAPTKITLSADKRSLKFSAEAGVAEQTKLRATLSKNSASSIAYSGYDPAVISVAADGTVTAVGLGTTTITATTFNGKSASCTITVRAPRTGINRNAVNVAHRGGAGYWPENTLEAFRNTPSTGAKAVELDARTTKDGVQVVHHDATFKVGDKKYTIKKLTLAQLKSLKPDLCTLDEALDVIAAGGLEVDLELKDTAKPSACVQAIKNHGLQDRTMYISFNSKLLKQVRQLDGSARIGYIINQTPSNLAKTLSDLKAGYVFQKQDYLTEDNLIAWQDAGLKVGVWTVNDESALRSWLTLGVDYITTNYPKLVTEILNQ